VASAHLIERVKDGLSQTVVHLDTPHSNYGPKWYLYGSLQRLSLISDAVTLLEEGEKLTEAEVKSLKDLYENQVHRSRADARKVQRDRYACVDYDAERREELYELGSRSYKALASASKTAGPVVSTESVTLR